MTALERIDKLIAVLNDDDNKQSDNMKKLRITPEILSSCMDFNKYGNKKEYPYIRILPRTKPSLEFCVFDNKLMANKLQFLSAYKLNPSGFFQSSDQICDLFRPLFCANDIINKKDCKCIKYSEIRNTECYWIEYAGSSINNGIILVFHGAAYVVNYVEWCFAECELLSKLTGMIVIAVKYRKAPQYSIQDGVTDGINVYKHFINNNYNNNISLIGDSSGGGLLLLLLQKIIKLNKINDIKIPLPNCCIIQNPWCNINYDIYDYNLKSKRSSYKYDSFLTHSIINKCGKLALGLMDNNFNKINNATNIDMSTYNPIYEDFSELKNISMYFMVGATDALLNDTLEVVKKAYNNGCKNIKCDIEPYMMHSWMLFVGKFPEADSTVVKISQFILNNKFNIKKKRGRKQNINDTANNIDDDIPKSKFKPDDGKVISV